MSHFVITGGQPLHGAVCVSGSKNAALPIMAAALLARDPVTLDNVPRLTDVHTLARVLHALGMRVTTAGDHALQLETVDARKVRAPDALVRRMRASFCVLGPLLARRGRAVVPLPGGCNIGARPVNLHLQALVALGAQITLERGRIVATAARLRGAEINLRGPFGPTVTGTANALCAAVLAEGETRLCGAAQEPEVVDLGRFLCGLGARIEGLGTAEIRIEGVAELAGGRHRLIPDRIEAATLLLAAAITRGAATITHVEPAHLAVVLAKLRAAGAEVVAGKNDVAINAGGPLHAVDVTALPYPGLPTDLQAQWTALMAVVDGVANIEDRVFPGRFSHVAELNRLGTRIVSRPGAVTVAGVDRLIGARVAASDLRASAALVLAGLAADGQTCVEHIRHLDRGYERLDRKLRQLGAQISRCR